MVQGHIGMDIEVDAVNWSFVAWRCSTFSLAVVAGDSGKGALDMACQHIKNSRTSLASKEQLRGSVSVYLATWVSVVNRLWSLWLGLMCGLYWLKATHSEQPSASFYEHCLVLSYRQVLRLYSAICSSSR